MFGYGKAAGVVLFGIIVPILLIFQAYTTMERVEDFISRDREGSLEQQIELILPHLQTANDYALYSQLSAERTNEAVVVNKQIMKVAIMNVGFAVASLGLMLVVLGFRDGGASAELEGSGLRFDFKTGSTGVVVFTIGAVMSAAAGILKNDYMTVPIPDFVGSRATTETGTRPGIDEELEAAFETCQERAGDAVSECFMQSYVTLEAQQ